MSCYYLISLYKKYALQCSYLLITPYSMLKGTPLLKYRGNYKTVPLHVMGD